MYKYLAGSLVDYSLPKEWLILKIDPAGLELLRDIIMGLLIEAQEEIDREKTGTVEKLLYELRKLEDTFLKKKKWDNIFSK